MIVRASARDDARSTSHAVRFPGPFPESNERRQGREDGTRMPHISRKLRDQIVRIMWTRTRLFHGAPHGVSRRPPNHREHWWRQGQPWRERPVRARAGPRRARTAGSLTPWIPAPTATPTPPAGGKERRPYEEGSARRTTKCLGTNGIVVAANCARHDTRWRTERRRPQ